MILFEKNIALFRAINDLGKEYTYLNPIFIFIAEYTVYFLALSMLIYWLTRKKENRIMVLCALISVAFAEIVGKIAGLFHFNYQPFAMLHNVNKLIDKDIGNSFPSDHTIIFFSICFSVWLFKKKRGFLWLILAILVGISRIWVGVHYPTDIVVGAVIAIATSLLSYKWVPKLGVKIILEIYEKIEKTIFPAKKYTK